MGLIYTFFISNFNQACYTLLQSLQLIHPKLYRVKDKRYTRYMSYIQKLVGKTELDVKGRVLLKLILQKYGVVESIGLGHGLVVGY